MAATADAIDSRAYRVAPTQRRGEALLLVGPAVLYLIAFSVYPLVTSLIRSFESYDPRTTSWTWIGLANYRQLFSDPEFWHTVEHATSKPRHANSSLRTRTKRNRIVTPIAATITITYAIADA